MADFSSHQLLPLTSDLSSLLALFAIEGGVPIFQVAADEAAVGQSCADAACLMASVCMCRGLFQVPCQVTEQLLALEPSSQQLLPPVFRPFKIRSEVLKLLAGGSLEPVALHMHALATSQKDT